MEKFSGIIKKIKAFLIENGFISAAALIVAGIALFVGMKFLMWGSLGFFAGRNWEIIKKLWNESKLKDKVEDAIDDFKS